MNRVRKTKTRGTRSGVHPRREAALAGSRDRPAVLNCDQRCERFATCKPDALGWVSKKQAAANLASTPSALRQRAARVGYVSPSRHAMPRRDQPRLCLDAAYFALQARGRRRK